MTPEEIAAQSGEIQRALTELGVTPQSALMAEGRQAAWARLGNAHRQAAERGEAARVAALEARIEKDAEIHVRRQMARLGIRGATGDRATSAQAQPALTSRPPPATLAGTETAPPRNPTEAFIEDTPGSALGIDWGAPRPSLAGSPSLPEAASSLPDWYTRGRPSEDMAARPLMPQSRLEEIDQNAANAALAMGMDTALQAGSVAVPVGRAVEGATTLVRGAGNLAARAPRTTAAAAGATALTAGSSGAESPSPADEAARVRASIAELQAQQKALSEEIAGLGMVPDPQDPQRMITFQQRFGNVGPNSTPAEIRALQEFLASPQGYGLYSVDQRGRPVRPDGIWFGSGGATSGTQAAMQAYLERIRAERATREARLGPIAEQLRPLQAQLGRLDANAASAASEANMSPLHRFVRDWVPPIAGIAGSLSGAGTRAGMRYLGDRASRRIAAEADASLARVAGGDAGARVGAVNQYFTRGGGEAPFAIVPGAPAGFVPRGGQSAMDLYQSGSPWMRGGDWGRTAGFAGVGALGAGRHFGVDREEVDAARKRYNENPTQENANALRRAEYIAAASQSGMAFGLGGAMSYPAASAFMRYRSPRPDLGRAEQEVMALNAVARGRNNQLPPLDHRRRNPNPDAEGGHWVPTNAPAPAPGAGPAWASPNAQQIFVSPSGENVVYSTTDAQGRVRWWRRLRGGPAEPFRGPPRTYRRVADAPESADGSTSVG